MPKISAKSIEVHVRRQTNRILDAAIERFSRDGYRHTGFGDIAKQMGLARNSLYRYFPSKDHILFAVMQREMGPFMEQTERLPARYADPLVRIDAWLDIQMVLATGPCYAMLHMIAAAGDVTEDLRDELRQLHSAPRGILQAAIADVVGGTRADVAFTTSMIVAMVQAAGALALNVDDVEVIGMKLKRSVRSLLAAGDTDE